MKTLKSLIVLALASTLFTACSSSEEKTDEGDFVTKEGSTVVSSQIEYQSGGKTMKGYLAVPAGEGPFPIPVELTFEGAVSEVGAINHDQLTISIKKFLC